MTADAVGGVFTYSVDLIRSLHTHGIETELVILGPPPSQDQMRRAHESGARIVHTLPGKLEWMPDCWSDVESRSEQLLDIAAQADVEVVHLNDYSSARLRFNVPAVVVGHSCVYSWFHAVRHCEPPREYLRYRTEVQQGLQEAAAVTAPTAAMLGSLRQVYGRFRETAPIFNAASAFSGTPRRKRPLILTAGRLWDEAKNAAALEGVASALSWPVVAAGPTQSPDGTRARFHHIHAVGELPRGQLMRLYSEAAVFALAARYEPFGLCVLEAAHAGCALVLSDIATFRELWSGCAVFVPPDDHVALSSELQRLAGDGDLRRRLAAAAQHRAERFRPDAQARAYAELYADVLCAKQPSMPVRAKEACLT